jgi:hypothetical protein
VSPQPLGVGDWAVRTQLRLVQNVDRGSNTLHPPESVLTPGETPTCFVRSGPGCWCNDDLDEVAGATDAPACSRDGYFLSYKICGFEA